MLVTYVLGAYLTAILDAILNISKRSMMPEWHQLDSSITMPHQQESAKKKTLKSSSRSIWFSAGLFPKNQDRTITFNSVTLKNTQTLPQKCIIFFNETNNI